eukprot:2094786-Amphidinium_carterae.1
MTKALHLLSGRVKCLSSKHRSKVPVQVPTSKTSARFGAPTVKAFYTSVPLPATLSGNRCGGLFWKSAKGLFKSTSRSRHRASSPNNVHWAKYLLTPLSLHMPGLAFARGDNKAAKSGASCLNLSTEISDEVQQESCCVHVGCRGALLCSALREGLVQMQMSQTKVEKELQAPQIASSV